MSSSNFPAQTPPNSNFGDILLEGLVVRHVEDDWMLILQKLRLRRIPPIKISVTNY